MRYYEIIPLASERQGDSKEQKFLPSWEDLGEKHIS